MSEKQITGLAKYLEKMRWKSWELNVIKRNHKDYSDKEIEKLEKSENNKDIKELNKLKEKHTLGRINFDSAIIIDFGNSLKSSDKILRVD